MSSNTADALGLSRAILCNGRFHCISFFILMIEYLFCKKKKKIDPYEILNDFYVL